jgi:hypothetical protein
MEQLMCGQDATCLFSPGIHSGSLAGFMIFALGQASNGQPLPRHPCLIIAWKTSFHSPPMILVHTMHILPDQARMLVQQGVAQRFFAGLEKQFVEADDLRRNVQLTEKDLLSMAACISHGSSGEATGLDVIITTDPLSPLLTPTEADNASVVKRTNSSEAGIKA